MKNKIKRVTDIVNSEHYTWGQNCDGWHLVKTTTLSVIKETMPTGSQEKLHYHEKSQQFFYIICGEATFEIEGVIYTVIQNQGISVDPNEKHKIINNKDRNLEFIVISTPSSHGDRINVE